MSVKDSTPKPAAQPVFENIDDAMLASSFDEDNSVDDFFDQLDEGIDNYFENLKKKK